MSNRVSARRTARLLGGAAGLLIALGASAQDAAVTPKAVQTFSGLGDLGVDQGSTPGLFPRVAPVYGPDGRFHGVTSSSREYSRWYSVAADGSDYQAQVLPTAVPFVQGSLVIGGTGASAKLFGSTTTTAFQANLGELPTALAKTNASGTAVTIGSFLSSVAAGPNGDVFYAARTSANPQIWRGLATGGFELVADFGRTEYLTYRELIPGIPMVDAYLKGQNTLAMVWSEADQVLYGVTEDTGVRGKSGDAATVPGDLPVGTLYRIKRSEFQPDGSGEIELLHTFAAARDGSPKTMSYRAPALLEVGEWLYGTTTKGVPTGNANANQDGRVWRVRKDCTSTAQLNCLEIVHRFDTNGTLSEEGGGFLPNGNLVYAADGNVYGTTYSGGKNGSTPAEGDGTMFRISNPTAANLDDVRFAKVHDFDTATTGKNPGGLGLGPKENGVQRVIGVAENGVMDGSATSTYYGTIYMFDVALPAASVTSFTVTGGVQTLQVAEGDKAVLSWASSGATVCTAGGDWNGAQQTEGSVEIGPLAYQADGYRYTLVCNSADGIASTEAVVKVTVAEPASNGGGNSGGSDSGGGGGGGGSMPLYGVALLALAALARRGLRASR